MGLFEISENETVKMYKVSKLIRRVHRSKEAPKIMTLIMMDFSYTLLYIINAFICCCLPSCLLLNYQLSKFIKRVQRRNTKHLHIFDNGTFIPFILYHQCFHLLLPSLIEGPSSVMLMFNSVFS